jgi:hypothetical protein
VIDFGEHGECQFPGESDFEPIEEEGGELVDDLADDF